MIPGGLVKTTKRREDTQASPDRAEGPIKHNKSTHEATTKKEMRGLAYSCSSPLFIGLALVQLLLRERKQDTRSIKSVQLPETDPVRKVAEGVVGFTGGGT